MAPLDEDVLKGVVAVALTAESETAAAIDALETFAQSCHEADAPAARLALRENLARLERAADRPGEDPAELSRLAHGVGRTAEELGEYDEARRGYFLAAGLTQAARGGVELGVVLHDIGDTWMAAGNGAEALAAYREAAEHKTQGASAQSLVTTLRALAFAEARHGTPEGCDKALAAALERISRDVHLPDATAVAGLARAVARDAERLGREACARQAQALAAGVLDPGVDTTPAADAVPPPQEALDLIDSGRERRRRGELEPARADLRRASELITAAGISAAPHLAAVARELHVIERALGESSEQLAADLGRRSAKDGDLDPGLADVLEALACRAVAAGDTVTARHALEWALAVDPESSEERKDPTLEWLRSLAGDGPPTAEPPPAPAAALHELDNPHRIWAFGLRRRVIDGEDLRPALRPILPDMLALLAARGTADGDPAAAQEWLSGIYAARVWIDDELLRDPPRLVAALVEDLERAWDEREELGEELTRALERYLLLQVIDQLWPQHVAHWVQAVSLEPDGQISGRRLATELWERFLQLLFNVEVEIEDPEPAPDPPEPEPPAPAQSQEYCWCGSGREFRRCHGAAPAA